MLRSRTSYDLNGITKGINDLTVLVTNVSSKVIYDEYEPRTRTVIILCRNGATLRTDDLCDFRPLDEIKLLNEYGGNCIFASRSPFSINVNVRTVVRRYVRFYLLPFRLTVA